MKKKLSKVLAIVLSLVMVAGLATIDASTAQAAKKKKATKLSIVSTGKKNVKSGQKRTIKIKGTNAKKAKWSVSGTGKSYIKLAKKTGKKVSFTVKENATGKAKITAKLTKKNKVSYTYKLSCDATAIALTGKDVYLGEVANLELAVTPSNAKLKADVAYGVFSDETAETESTDAVVTAGAMGCEFYTAKAGTYYVKATAGEMTSIAKVAATEKVAKLESVQQTKANELELIFDSDASKVVPADIEIKNGNGTVITADKVTVDKDDNKKATVSTFNKMIDGKVNTISYKAGTPLEFQASDGKVASIDITPDTVPIKTAVEVKAVALDTNKVILDEFVYGKENTEKYVFEIESTTGSADPSTGKLTMEEIGGKAEVTCTYDTGEVDASNQPRTVVGKKTIVAVAEGQITGAEKVKFMRLNFDPETGKSYDDMVKEHSDQAKDKVRVLPATAGDKFYLYTVVKDENGYEKVNGSLTEAGYVLKSSADEVLIIEGNALLGAKAGNATILVCDDEGNVKFTIPVEVQAASKLTKLDISSSDTIMKLTTGNIADPGAARELDNGKFDFKALDQYGEDYGYVTAEAKPEKDNHTYINVATVGEDVTVEVNSWAEGESGQITRNSNPTSDDVEGRDYLNAGSTVRTPYTVEVTDTQDDSIKLTKKVYVDLSRPSKDLTKIALVVDKNEKTKTVNTALNDKDAKGYNELKIRLAVYDNKGVLAHYAYLPTQTAMEFLKAGKDVGKDNVAQNGAQAYKAGVFSPIWEKSTDGDKVTVLNNAKAELASAQAIQASAAALVVKAEALEAAVKNCKEPTVANDSDFTSKGAIKLLEDVTKAAINLKSEVSSFTTLADGLSSASAISASAGAISVSAGAIENKADYLTSESSIIVSTASGTAFKTNFKATASAIEATASASGITAKANEIKAAADKLVTEKRKAKDAADIATRDRSKVVKVVFDASVLEDVDGIANPGRSNQTISGVIRRADNARYTLRVKNLGIKENAVDYSGSSNYIVNFTVENTQKDISVQLNVRNGINEGNNLALVAAKAFRVNADDTQNYSYDVSNNTATAAYGFKIAKNGAYNQNNKYSFNKLVIYVPYRTDSTGDRVIYNEVTKSVSGAVTPE